MSLKIELGVDDLRPVIEAVVTEMLSQQSEADQRIAYTEAEAAELLGMARHQLRDRRLQGEIKGKKVGGRWYYSAQVLRQFIAS